MHVRLITCPPLVHHWYANAKYCVYTEYGGNITGSLVSLVGSVGAYRVSQMTKHLLGVRGEFFDFYLKKNYNRAQRRPVDSFQSVN